ncbi:MAG: 16S rRNA (guanine(966)-N(2))-methyltransferase RsmD [Anaerovoracaceae bacterium]|jgi:16S rRNA (guanine966-N2)-methyltransferase
MRIIAGDFKGRKLYTPFDDRVRPTSDQVKESIFNIIAMYVEDSVVIDLFSGTGNLGLEAISRGASRCYFVDNSRESIELTKKNIHHCKVEDQSIVLHGNYEQMLGRIKEKADMIFLDPPYEHGMITKCLDAISKQNILSESGIIVAEYDAGEVLPDTLYTFKKIKEKKYGRKHVTIFALITEE